MFPDLSKFSVVAVDCETTGLNWWEDKVFGISLSTPDGNDYYWDVRIDHQIKEWLQDQVNRSNCPLIINHNMKFDLHMFREFGINIDPRKTDCTMIRAALLNEHLKSYSLDDVAKKYLKIRKISDIYEDLAKMFGGKSTRKVQMKNLHLAPVELVSPYAKQDTRVALELWNWQEKEIEKQELREICNFERRLFPYIYDMEHRGLRVDIEEAELAIQRLEGRIAYLRNELDGIAGFSVNPNPSSSIHKLFKPKWNKNQGCWIAVDGTILNSTDAGNASIDADALNRMKHPAASLILRTRQLIKAKDTFLGGHVIDHAIERNNGFYVHPNINQTKGDDIGGTGTGRLSYTNPALQQIPVRNKEVAEIVRPCFLPDPGQKWSYGDLDQIDFRVFAHYANVPSIIEAYQADPYLDFHQKVADLTGLPRTAKDAHGLGLGSMANAKQTNLAMVFSIGPGHLADIFGLPWQWDEFEDERGKIIKYQKAGPEIQEIIDNYHQMIPGVREITSKAKSIAKSRGYVRTLRKRHIRFPYGYGCRKAAGLIYQGSAADINKELIIRFCEYFKSEAPDCRMLLNIHDESSFSMNPDRKKSIKILKDLKYLAQDWPELRVPINIDFSDLADNWWKATEADTVTDPRK